MTRDHGCVCFIVPSKMLRKLADKATGAERQTLLDHAEISANMRGKRSASSFAALMATPAGEKRRTVYDCGGKKRLPGKLVRGEGDPESKDPAVNQAYDAAGATYDFYMEVLRRNSIDGRGLRIDSTCHYDQKFNNAFWDGRQMVYGDGDGKFFTGFTGSIDVIAHELTHGVTQYTVPGGSGLVYEGQSGALNESWSDVMGSVVKQWRNQQTVDKADWLIGAGIMTPQVGKALRSMKEPGNTAVTWVGDDQPGDFTKYVEDGDVHTNSGIPNHAFYLAATALGGRSWEKAGPIWYKALALLQATASFKDAAEATVQAAGMLFSSAEKDAVAGAWKQVHVL